MSIIHNYRFFQSTILSIQFCLTPALSTSLSCPLSLYAITSLFQAHPVSHRSDVIHALYILFLLYPSLFLTLSFPFALILSPLYFCAYSSSPLPLPPSRPPPILVIIIIIQEVDHPNIIKLREVFFGSRTVYLVMELCKGGELFDEITHNAQRGLSEVR